MVNSLVKIIFFLGLPAAVFAWVLSAPTQVDLGQYAQLEGDAERGALVFAAGGCSSCHAVPEAKDEAKLVLAGGLEFHTAFGTFIAPNISPHPQEGIGAWSIVDLGNAMTQGVSPDKKHYFPAFPYNSYQSTTPQDIADLHAYMMTLPESATPSVPHKVGFPFNIRRAMGLWKWMFVKEQPIMAVPADDPVLQRGQYLVEVLGHCAECHTPRNLLGGLKYGAWMAGGPNPDGPGRIPNITPSALEWSAEEIAEYLKTGFTPEFDVVGGSMVGVQENMALLSDEDRMAIAAYLKNLEPK